MLFSSGEVAGYINDSFEPAWESVRPAPLVTIDFGNGHTVRRTLQGNIATYVCGPDGVVYDVLPGIYAPAVYRKQLESLKTLADTLQQADAEASPANVSTERWFDGERLGYTLVAAPRGGTQLSDKQVLSSDFMTTFIKSCKDIAPLMKFLAAASGTTW